jgi:uncharacterized protein
LPAPPVLKIYKVISKGEVTMNRERNKQVVIDAWKAFASGDAQRVSDVFSDDAEWLAPAGNATAVALNATHHMVGREAITQFITSGFRKVFQQDVQSEFRNLYADGYTVILEWRLQARVANGKLYDNEYCFIIELEGERIRRVREYMDTQRAKDVILS